MKKILCLFAIALLVISCGKKNAESSYIPKDAIAVMYVNLESLSKKSDGIDFTEMDINKMLKNDAPKEVQDFMNTYLTSENIEATFRKEFMLGFVSMDRMAPKGGLIIPIKSAEAFEKMILPMIEKSPMQKEENAGKNGAFTVYSTGQVAIGWDDTTALVIGARDFASTELTDLTNLESSNTVYKTSYYKSFFDTKKDMGIHVTSTPLAELANSLASMFAGINVDLEDNNFSYYVNFEDDQVIANMNVNLNDDFKSLIGSESWMTTTSNKDMLEVLPENPNVFMKLSIDPVKLFTHIEGLKDNRILPKEVRAKMKDQFSKMEQEMNREIGMPPKELAGIFSGSAMVAVNEGKTVKDTVYNYNYYNDEEEIEVVERKIPYAYGVIGIDDKAKFDALMTVAMQKSAPKATKGKEYYELSKDMFAVIKNDFIFITNDVTKADEVYKNGSLAANMSNFAHTSNLSNTMYVYVNPKATGMMSDLTSSFGRLNPYNAMMKDEYSTASEELYQKYIGDIHYFVNVDGIDAHTEVKGEGNSLENMLRYMDEMAKQLSEMAKKVDEVEVEETYDY